MHDKRADKMMFGFKGTCCIIGDLRVTSTKKTHAVSRSLNTFLAMYSTLCSPQPSVVVFVLNVDVMFNRKPSESVNIGSNHDTSVFSLVAKIVIFSGHRIRSGFLVSEKKQQQAEQFYKT